MNEIISKKKIILPPNLTNYDEVRQRFSWSYYRELLKYNINVNVAEVSIIRKIREGKGNRTALIWFSEKGERVEITYNQIAKVGKGVARLLREKGIKKGDRVVIMSKRVPALYYALAGISLVGAVAVPVFSSFGVDPLKYRIHNSGSKLLMIHESLKDKILREVNIESIIIHENSFTPEVIYDNSLENEITSRDDPFFILYTSGSTGLPKGIWHSHDLAVYYYVSGKFIYDMHDQDLFWHTGDPAWVSAFSATWTSWINEVPLISYEGRFGAEEWYRLMEESRVSVISTTPTALRLLRKAEALYKKFDLSSIRHIQAGGEYVDPSTVKWGLQAFGVPIHDAYGQTETANYVIANYISMPIKVGSIGKPLPGIEALIVDEHGNPLPPNSKGILAFKPGFPALAKGIWGNEQRWRESFRNGFYLTGDMALMDEDGYIWYLGRLDDVIKVSGYRVSPIEIEGILSQHNAVAEVAVVGIPDEERGNKIKAFIVLKRGFDASDELKEEISNFVKNRLASHLVPKEIEFVKDLPRTLSGKIMRRLLRAKETNSPHGDISTLENPSIINEREVNQ